MSDVFNIFGDDWDDESDREGYRHRSVAIGKRLGASLLGASVYELPPGERTWPYHYETVSEEWLLVVSGRPTLRTPDGERELAPGDVAVFPQGPTGAHGIENRSDETARIVIFSSKGPLDVVHYPDTGKVGVWTADRGYIALTREQPDLDYWEVEE
ncbi:MAG TPA: cupin domain-containing protein [Gaiellaceae bacterium]|nr:cupin domain-containing protein [Gaiellaceae bacterium]